MPHLTLVEQPTLNEYIAANFLRCFKDGMSSKDTYNYIREKGVTQLELMAFVEWRKTHPAAERYRRKIY